MTVEEGCEFFKNIPAIYSKLTTETRRFRVYKDWPTGHYTSGGEAQKIKLAKELQKDQQEEHCIF